MLLFVGSESSDGLYILPDDRANATTRHDRLCFPVLLVEWGLNQDAADKAVDRNGQQIIIAICIPRR